MERKWFFIFVIHSEKQLLIMRKNIYISYTSILIHWNWIENEGKKPQIQIKFTVDRYLNVFTQRFSKIGQFIFLIFSSQLASGYIAQHNIKICGWNGWFVGWPAGWAALKRALEEHLTLIGICYVKWWAFVYEWFVVGSDRRNEDKWNGFDPIRYIGAIMVTKDN